MESIDKPTMGRNATKAQKPSDIPKNAHKKIARAIEEEMQKIKDKRISAVMLSIDLIMALL